MTTTQTPVSLEQQLLDLVRAADRELGANKVMEDSGSELEGAVVTLVKSCDKPAELAVAATAVWRQHGMTDGAARIMLKLVVALLESPVAGNKRAGRQLAEKFRHWHCLIEMALGQAMVNGDGGPTDFEGARTIAEKLSLAVGTDAAERATFLLGDLNVFGTIAGSSVDAGLRYYEEAARAGCVEASYMLGLWYDGKLAAHIPRARDPERAAFHYEAAAIRHHLKAATNLGLLEMGTSFVGASVTSGVSRLAHCAERGDPLAAEALVAFNHLKASLSA